MSFFLIIDTRNTYKMKENNIFIKLTLSLLIHFFCFLAYIINIIKNISKKIN